MTLALIASALLLLQAGSGSVEGIVSNSVTGRPVAGAQVTAMRMPAGPAAAGGVITMGVAGGVIRAGEAPQGAVLAGVVPVQPSQLPPARTDANGQFIFRDLEPGNYLIRASAEGYAQQEYNTRPGLAGGMSAQVNLTAGQALKNTVLRLTPGGTVTGRVTGSNGEALANIEVSLLRSMYDPEGRRNFQQSATAQTNDRGEYRLFWVTPGQYYLSAGSSNRPMPGIRFNPLALSNKYPRTFYPAAPDIASASPIEVQPAAELSGVDFRLNEQETYRVRGRVVDPSSGQAPPRSASISIMPRDSVISTGLFSSNSPYNPVDGTFELRDVPSGSYWVRAQLPFTGRPEPGQPFPTPPMATAPVDVAGADIDGVVLTFVPPASISGRVRIEGASSPQEMRATIMLRPAASGPLSVPPPRPVQTNADGTFTIEGVAPGEYRVTANVFPGAGGASVYLQAMRFGAVDVLAHRLVLSGPVSDTLEVVFGANAGQITGAVRGNPQQESANAQVVLVPDQRDRHDLYKFAITNPSGLFTLRSVPPGSYKVFAWDGIDQFSWFDPAVLARYESQGVRTTVAASSSSTLDLQIIPLSGPQ